ncbi:hypothetical protein [Carnobacterium inhibens]|uniref:hypothetical protein n=1 Tax=Carnobacterium inhibens TaxID=147709 RepID=UPI000552AC45|nr:hypothetical protein [Carnobacterium inhibens]
MVKRPFAIRVEENVSTRYKALASVLNIDSAHLLEKLINDQEKILSNEEKEAYIALLKVWKKSN